MNKLKIKTKTKCKAIVNLPTIGIMFSVERSQRMSEKPLQITNVHKFMEFRSAYN